MENSTKSIDDQLAEANRQFDARLAGEKDPKPVAVEVKPGVRATPKPEKPKRAKPKRSRHAVGDVAHQHYRETVDEVLEIDCLYIEHTVRDRKGFMINDTRYRGKVIVPVCVANTLSEMENKHRMMERGVFEDRGRAISLGELKG